MGFLIYFFNMQCPDCGYISFKQEKSCGSCGFNFKKAAISNSSLFRNESFTIFSNKTSEEEQGSVSASAPQAEEGIAVIDPPEEENPELESGEFLLNLSEANQEESKNDLKSETSGPGVGGFTPMEFGTDAEVNLEEMEVEGLGLGLEPLEEEPPTTLETSKNELEEVQLETNKEPASINVDLTPDSPENIELNVDESDISSSNEQEISDSNSEEITLNINDIEETPEIDLQQTDEEEPEIITSSSQDTSEAVEPEVPVLDLGDNDEIVLDLNEDSEPVIPDPSPTPSENDELEIKLEIDDSDGPLIINDDEIPEVEIEDLGLELEEPDPPPDPEKS